MGAPNVMSGTDILATGRFIVSLKIHSFLSLLLIICKLVKLTKLTFLLHSIRELISLTHASLGASNVA